MLRYAISDGQFALGLQPRGRLLGQAEFLAAQRIDFFLLREANLPARELATLTQEILAILAGSATRLLLHSRADIAAATGAQGVHLPSTPDALIPAQVRAVYVDAGLPSPIVSLSCHTSEELLRARAIKPDLILFGPIFGKTIAGRLITPPAGLKALRQACNLGAPIPVLALGGVTTANTAACLEAGAAGIAAIRLFSQLK